MELELDDRVPDAKTVWLFREGLKALRLVEDWLPRCHAQLARHGYVARAGQLVDAQIKAGTPPADGSAHKRRQQDVDARWTKQNQETHYGYKNHVNADEAHKVVQD